MSYMAHSRIERYIHLFVVLGIVAVFSVNGISYVNQAQDPAAMDTVGFLTLALDIKKSGGLIAFLRDCISGRYTHAIQHPLYIMILSGFAKPSFVFFVQAKMVTLFIGLLNILSILWVGSRRYAFPVGAAVALLLSVNHAFLSITSQVSCDSLFILCMFWSWFFLTQSKDRPTLYLIAGVFCGFAYLAKGTGLFVLLGFMLSSVLIFQLRFPQMRQVWYYLAGFIIISSPLLTRNIVVYHNPIYNLNSRIMWLDSWEQFHSPDFQENKEQYTAFQYLQTHSISSIIDRQITGMKKVAQQFYNVTRLPGGKGRSYHPFIFLFLFIFFCYGCWREPPFRVYFTVSFFFIYYILFAWFAAVMVASRYTLPLVPIFFMTGIGGAWLFCQRHFGESKWLRAAVSSGMIVVLFVFGGKVYSHRNFQDPQTSYSIKPGYIHLMKWLEGNAIDVKYMLGPSHAYRLFYWSDRLNTDHRFVMPLVDNFEALNDYIKMKNIRYVVVDSETLTRRKFLSPFIVADNEQGLRTYEPLPDWMLIFEDPSPRTDYLVFRVR